MWKMAAQQKLELETGRWNEPTEVHWALLLQEQVVHEEHGEGLLKPQVQLVRDQQLQVPYEQEDLQSHPGQDLQKIPPVKGEQVHEVSEQDHRRQG